MALRPYIVRAGDYLTRLAHARGLDPAKVWSDPANRELRELRANPEMLAPGDVLFFPESARPKEHDFGPGDTTYTVDLPKVRVRVVLRDNGQPIADEPYVIEGRATPDEGRTGPDGAVAFEVPVDVTALRLVLLRRSVVYPIAIGHLDPVEELSGLRQRLAHLGHYGFSVDVPPDAVPHSEARDRRAIEAFQRAHRLPVTGEADAATRERLVRLHGR